MAVNKRETIAKNIARYFHDGDFVNLGVGIPTLSANYIPEGTEIILHAESGFAGQDGAITPPWDVNDREACDRELNNPKWADKENGWKTGHKDICDASGNLAILSKGASCFDSVVSFMMARGGHLDATVLGGLQVDEEGNLANWMVPGKNIPGMGGAMDLVSGAKKVIVAMEHNAKDGAPKVLKKCVFPLTAINCVSVLVTDICIIEFVDGKMTVVAMAPGMTKEELQKRTEATLHFADKIDVMDIVEE